MCSRKIPTYYYTKMKKQKNIQLTAAGLMTQLVPKAHLDDTVEVVKKKLLAEIHKTKSINYIYVLDKDNLLKGAISIKELFQQTKNQKISAVMAKDIVYAYAESDREEIAYLAVKNNLKSIPIIDKDDRFIGAVLSDDILSIVYKELQEDVSHFIGLDHKKGEGNVDDVRLMSVYASLKNRLPWLIIGILGGILTAQVISLFEHTLAKNIILAAFIPLVVYIASAIATQAGFFIVRDLALNKTIDFLSYTLKQFKVILLMGVVISLLIFAFVFVFYGEIGISLVLSLSIFLTILSAIVTGVLIPYAFSRLKFDPANASGPIATIIQDLLSVLIYLMVANSLM